MGDSSVNSKPPIAKIRLEEVPDKALPTSVAALVRSTMELLFSDLHSSADVSIECIPPLIPASLLPRYPADGDGVIVSELVAAKAKARAAEAEAAALEARAHAKKVQSPSKEAQNLEANSGALEAGSNSIVGRRRINLAAAANRNTSAATLTSTSSVSSLASAANAPSASTSVSSAHSSQGAATLGGQQQLQQTVVTPEMASVAITAMLMKANNDDLAPHENPSFPKKFYHELTDDTISECLECCRSAIANATFSESYPDYCLRELQAFPHKYLQGTFARCNQSKKIIAFVITNGMDEYGNLKGSLGQLRQAQSKALAATNGIAISSPTSPTSSQHGFPAVPSSALVGGAGTTVTNTGFTEECLKIGDISDFVHVTLIATHESHRGKGLGKKLMLADSLRWLLRGRTRAYLNMALERLKIPVGARLIDGVVTPPPQEALSQKTLVTGSKRRRASEEGPQVSGNNDETDALQRMNAGRGDEALGAGAETSDDNAREGEEEEDYDIVCVASEASRRLYTSLGFTDVVPSKIDPETNEVKWTPKEEESGKVMANLDMKESARTITRHLFGDSAPLYSGRKVLKLKK